MSYFTKNTRILVVDTETANTLEDNNMQDVLVYDCGWAVCDIYGTVYDTASYVNEDIFYKESDLMESAYYSKKIPQYLADIQAGTRKVAGIWEIRRKMFETIKKYNIQYVAAYNARFDANALNRTMQFITKSFMRYFFKFNQIVWLDIMKMAQDAVVTTREYKKWAEDYGYTLRDGRPRKTAEMIYQYATGLQNFEESHTGLEDVLIEVYIMAYCFAERKRRKVKMRTLLYEKPLEIPESTPFQRKIARSIKKTPVMRVAAI